jgi:hypothetical protein
MNGTRYFGRVMHVTGAGALVLERDDGGGRVYAPSGETVLAGDPAPGDRVNSRFGRAARASTASPSRRAPLPLGRPDGDA